MESYQALYYPYIHFKKDAWVKLSALYWDKLKRIAPYGFPTKDSETVLALGNFIESVGPEMAGERLSDTFSAFFADYGDQLREKYSLEHIDEWPAVAEHPGAGDPPAADLRLHHVRIEKMHAKLYDGMIENKIGKKVDGQWIGMHPRVASVYMHALAEHLAEKNGLRPLTDETLDHIAASNLSVERLANALLGDVSLVDKKATNTEMEIILASVAFKTLVPVNLENLSVDKILKFREQYPDERQRFQEAVSKVLADRSWLSSISDPVVLEGRLRDEIDREWAKKLRDFKEKLSGAGIDTIFSTANLTTSLPPLMASAVTGFGLPLNAIALAGASVALAAIPMLRTKRDATKKELGDSPVAYLYRMEQDLQPIELRNWCMNALRRFTLGV